MLLLTLEWGITDENTDQEIYMITTTKGPMPESILTKKTGVIDNKVEKTLWIEYWLKDELVHRSVHIKLKQGVEMFPEAALI